MLLSVIFVGNFPSTGEFNSGKKFEESILRNSFLKQKAVSRYLEMQYPVLGFRKVLLTIINLIKKFLKFPICFASGDFRKNFKNQARVVDGA